MILRFSNPDDTTKGLLFYFIFRSGPRNWASSPVRTLRNDNVMMMMMIDLHLIRPVTR